jgi:ketosteroid isomerase-like protein
MSEYPEERITVAKQHSGGFDMGTARAIIEQRSREFEDALRRGDSAAVGEIYTVDTRIVGALVGRENLIREAQAMIDVGSTLTLRMVDIWGDDNILIEDAYIEFMDNSGSIESQGDVLLVWKREDDAWRIFRDVYKPRTDGR